MRKLFAIILIGLSVNLFSQNYTDQQVFNKLIKDIPLSDWKCEYERFVTDITINKENFILSINPFGSTIIENIKETDWNKKYILIKDTTYYFYSIIKYNDSLIQSLDQMFNSIVEDIPLSNWSNLDNGVFVLINGDTKLLIRQFGSDESYYFFYINGIEINCNMEKIRNYYYSIIKYKQEENQKNIFSDIMD